MPRPHISLIVAAMLPGYGIGAKGKLPWRLKQEIKYFKDVTSRAKDGAVNAVIMGRKTWDSIPAKFRPLPNRLNVVLSRSFTNSQEDGVLYYNSIDSLLKTWSAANYQHENVPIGRIFVIGGAQIYNSFINDERVDLLLVTDVKYVGEEDQKPVIDTFLDWDLSGWKRSDIGTLKAFVDVPFTEGAIREGSYEYEYTMFERK